MQLKQINKQTYRKRLNRITILSILALVVISLSSSTLLIMLLSDGQGSNFWLNFTGVVIACIVVGFSLKKLRTSDYFTEVAYIWALKHELNLIQRKIRAIDQAAAEHNDADAILIQAYSYAGSALIWQLDDNTLMMSELNMASNKLQQKITDLHLDIDINNYHRSLLDKF